MQNIIGNVTFSSAAAHVFVNKRNLENSENITVFRSQKKESLQQKIVLEKIFVRKRCGSILDEQQLPALIVGRLFT